VTSDKGGEVPGDSLTPPLGDAHHHGYLVEDIEATVEQLVEGLGAQDWDGSGPLRPVAA
jgi:hypothetical protein